MVKYLLNKLTNKLDKIKLTRGVTVKCITIPTWKDPKTNIILGFISSYYKKLNKWIRRLLIFIIVILFYINGGFRFLSEEVIFLALNYKLEIKYLLQLSLILPIVLSIIALYILMDVRIKGEITISPKAEGEEKIS